MKVIFPGTFDPLTNGHLDLIVRASKMFDEVIVLLAENTSKKTLFSFEERKLLIEDEIKDLGNVSVISSPHELTVDAARRLGACGIVRGVRNAVDFEYEKSIASMNRHLAPEIETILLTTDEKYGFVSSSMIKEVAGFGGDLCGSVPEKTALALKNKLKEV